MPVVPTGGMTTSSERDCPAEPLQKDALKAQRLLRALRFVGYAGVQLNALLVPLLVFRLSASTALAGAALLVEWLPKLALYLTGGALTTRFGRQSAHLGLEWARLAALTGLGLCALGWGSVWVVALCAAAYQCSNALSNILFETAVTQWWSPSTRAIGHASLLKADQAGCLLALLAGLLLKEPVWLVLAGILLQGALVTAVAHTRLQLHPLGQPGASPRSLGSQLRADAQAASQGPLVRFAAAAALLGVPAALTFSALAYFLDRAQPGAANNAHWISALLLVRTGLSLVVLQWVQAALKSAGRERPLAMLGLAVLALAALAVAAPLPLLGLLAAVAVLGTAGSLYLPLLRHVRQDLIGLHVPQGSRAGVTGILISVEAGAYLIAAVLLATMGGQLVLMALLAALCAVAGIFLVPWGRAGSSHEG